MKAKMVIKNLLKAQKQRLLRPHNRFNHQFHHLSLIQLLMKISPIKTRGQCQKSYSVF
jgi:hypothetical protein